MKALSRLRMSSHMLENERGRHVKPQKIPLEQRTCQRCTLNSVDDEIHFLITCSYFATQRTSLLAESKLLNGEFDSLSNDDKFIYIMSSTHRPLVICLAKYTYMFSNLKRVAYLRFIKRLGRRMTGAAGESSNHPLMKSSMLSGEHHCGISDWCGWWFL